MMQERVFYCEVNEAVGVHHIVINIAWQVPKWYNGEIVVLGEWLHMHIWSTGLGKTALRLQL